MLLGYNTNGLAFHRWQDGLELLAEVGYESVAITVDQHCLNPFASNFASELDEMRRTLQRLRLRSVIETGARFLLDPRQKHEPTLISPEVDGRSRRVDFLRRCIDIASELNSDAVSFWSGVSRLGLRPYRVGTESQPTADNNIALQWLLDGCRQVTAYAEQRGVQLAFEPEPGMLIETLEQYGQLANEIGSPRFGLTIDIGHVQCVEAGSIPDHLRQWAGRLCNVHIEDMRRGVHEHLRFGEGEIDFPPVMAALRAIGYTGCVNVELSRHSHMAPDVLRESFEFLSRL
ncbi:MAG: sugar phosphate isomerase/epimerase [Planctomycetaceae bacterium]|nr:sugar phosphate isomerase/epimerase [Planctomycetaceae bacterium]